MENLEISIIPNDNLEKWEILEIQGKIDTNNQPLDGHELGYLFENSSKTELIIGNVLIEGKSQVKLPKPLYVLEKNENGIYVVKSVIQEKTQFKTRPTPLSPKTVSEKTGRPLSPVSKEKVEKKLIF